MESMASIALVSIALVSIALVLALAPLKSVPTYILIF